MFLAPGVLAAQGEDRAAILEEGIDSLRANAESGEALGLARELLSLRNANPETPAYECTDARRLVETLEIVVKLPADAQEELASAVRMTGEYMDLFDGDDYEGALDLAEKQLVIFKKYLGDRHEEVAKSMSNLAYLLSFIGENDRVEPLYREALDIDREVFGDLHPNVASDLNNLGFFYHELGDLEGAEPRYKEALRIYLALFGESNDDVALVYNNLAELFGDRGDFISAQPLLRKSLVIYRRLYGAIDRDVADGLYNLARLEAAKGNHETAEPLFREALSIYRQLEEPLDVALALTGLASLLQDLEDYGSAEPMCREALDIFRELTGGEHEYVAAALNNLADLMHDMGDYHAAEPLYREALDMRRALHEGEHRHIAAMLLNLARNYRDMGEYGKAEPLYREAVGMFRTLFGEEHPNMERCLFSMGNFHVARGEYEAADDVLGRAVAAYEAARRRVGSGLEQVTFQRSPYPKLALTKLLLGKENEAWPSVETDLGRALADLLFVSGKRSLSAGEAAVEDSLQAAIGALEEECAVYRDAALSDTTGGMGRLAAETRNRLMQAEASFSAFQREVAGRHPVTEGRAFQIERIQAVIPDAAALVGWLDVEEKKDEFVSWVYLIRRSGPVEWFRLPVANRDGYTDPFLLTAGFCRELANAGSAAAGVRHDAAKLWSLRLAPAARALEGVRHLVVIPSGAMLGVPVEAVVDNGGRYLGERFSICYVPSATVYAWLREMQNEKGNAGGGKSLLVGDPPFNEAHRSAMETASPGGPAGNTDTGGEQPAGDTPGTGASTRQETAERPENPADDEMRISVLRSSLAGGRSVLGAMPRLAATRDEIMEISAIAPDPTILLGTNASEMELFRLAGEGRLGDYSVIHIATHALLDDRRVEHSSLVMSQVDLPDQVQSALDGARIFDGLVSAGEIVREWDLDADLVTLSACRTGLGRRVAGEGYIGLAHAFLQAGAKSLLVSLWKVEDRATSLLMTRFYENYFGRRQNDDTFDPMTATEALREAKDWLREYGDDSNRRPYRHPFYWSSFILIGDGGS